MFSLFGSQNLGLRVVQGVDTGKSIENLRNLTDSLIGAIDAELTTRDQARKVWASQASELGIESEAPDQAEVEADRANADEDKAEAVEAEGMKSVAEGSHKKRPQALKRGRRRYGAGRATEAERLKAKKWAEEKKKVLAEAVALERKKTAAGVG